MNDHDPRSEDYGRNIKLLMISSTIIVSGSQIILPYISLYWKIIGKTYIFVGILSSFTTLIQIFGFLISGSLSDKFGRKRILFLGYILFSLTCLGFMFAQTLPLFALFFSLYGLTYALIDANQRAYASDLLPEELRGSGLGVFHTLIGFATLPASVIAGLLWQINPELTFMYGAVMSLIASGLIGAWRIKTEKKL